MQPVPPSDPSPPPAPDGETERLRLLLVAQEQARLDRLEARILDAAAARGTVREVIVDALRDAQVADARRLAGVIAPAVVSSIHAEIRNSRDMMVDALYPITGRMVSAAVRDAFQRLLVELDRRIAGTLPFERIAARLEAMVTGKPVAEVLLRRNPSFLPVDVLLIHRGSGLLIHREAEGASPLDGDVLSGLLTAILGFAGDAFGTEGDGDVKTLAFGAGSVHLAASPALLLALRGEGTAPATLPAVLDEALAQLIDSYSGTARTGDTAAGLADFTGTLDDAVRERLALDLRALLGLLHRLGQPKRRQTGALITLALIAAGVIGWFGWSWLDARRIAGLEAEARAAIAEVASAQGWPVTVQYHAGVVHVGGLVPDDASVAAVTAALQRRLGDAQRADGLVSAGRDREAAARTSLAAELTRLLTAQALEAGQHRDADRAAAANALTALTQQVQHEREADAAAAAAQLAALTQRLAEVDQQARQQREADGAATAARLAALTQRLGELERTVADAVGQLEQSTGSGLDALGNRFGGALSDLGGALGSLRRQLEGEIAALSNRLDQRTTDLTETLVDYGRDLQTLDARVRPLEDIAGDPARLLAEAVAEIAIFFVDDDIFADPITAAETVDRVAALLAEVPQARLRVVGFSDPTGRAGLNASLSQQRAERVRGLLIASGVDPERLLAVGRATERRLAAGSGPNPRDRRVEFELVRAGEP